MGVIKQKDKEIKDMSNGVLSRKLSNLFVEKDIEELVLRVNNQEEYRNQIEKL